MPMKEVFTKDIFLRMQGLVFLVFLFALGLAAALLMAERKELRRAEQYRLMDETAGRLNNAAGLHALERGIGNTILGTEFPTPAMIQRFNEIGGKADVETNAALGNFKELMATDFDRDVERLLAGWKRRLAGLDAARKRVAAHDIKTEEWVAAASENIETEFHLRDTIFAPHEIGEKIMYYNIVIRANVAKLCEYAGRERALLGGLIAAGRPIPPETAETLRGYRVIVDDTVGRVLGLRQLEETPASLLAAIDRFERVFLTDYENTRKAVYAASAARAPYPLSGEAWLVKATEAIDSGLDISRAVGDISRGGVMDIRNHALIRAGLYMLVFLAALAVFGLILWQKAAQGRLQIEKGEAEKATEMKNKLLSLVAHDLRGGFSTILSLLKRVGGEAESPPAVYRATVSRVILIVENLLRMTEEILSINRIKGGQLGVKREFMDVRRAVDLVFERVAQQADEKGATLVNAVPAGIRFYADPNLMEEVFHNLITNAIKFCKKNEGRVEVGTPFGRNGVVTVRDNGIGIPEALLGKIFKHEEKTSRAGTSGERGTGLGLPLCGDIIAAHSGTIAAESAAGGGSMFTITLPYRRPYAAIMGDDVQFISTLEKFFANNLNVEVVEVDTPYALTKTASSGGCPEFIIIAAQAGNANILNFLSALRGIDEYARTPLIVAGNEADAANKAQYIRAGANHFLQKQNAEKELLVLAKRYIGPRDAAA
ncbi:MAG: nitrate- and nitrite sensing domain-containing protein [Nitrospinae bacterium]|nr:nitrate- and nitrite sensing domain-containing protein [Nitrospinota bacterium]